MLMTLIVDEQNVRSRWRWMASTRRMAPTTVPMTIIVCLSVGVVSVVNSQRAMLSPCWVIPTTSSASTAPSVGQYFMALSNYVLLLTNDCSVISLSVVSFQHRYLLLAFINVTIMVEELSKQIVHFLITVL